MTGRDLVKVKICGITNVEDALASVGAGADALGFIFYAKSPRFVSPPDAGRIVRSLPPFVTAVGVFVNETAKGIADSAAAAKISVIQLHGDESPEYCESLGLPVIKSFRISRKEDLAAISRYKVRGVLLDSFERGRFGGTGRTFDWELLRGFEPACPIILSGGLNSGNVEEAIRRTSPYAVDVSSGVEAKPGRKDIHKIKAFMSKVRNF